jgi:hypothetical protein
MADIKNAKGFYQKMFINILQSVNKKNRQPKAPNFDILKYPGCVLVNPKSKFWLSIELH